MQPMEWLKYISAPFTVLYGLLAFMAGPQQWRRGNIPPITANALLAAGLLLIISGYLVWVASNWALWLLAAGLLSMHVLAAANSQRIQGKVVWRQHAGRLAFSLALFALSYLALRG